jgi:hypothetical protein
VAVFGRVRRQLLSSAVDHYYFLQEDWAALDGEGPQYDAGQTAMSRSPVVSALVLLVEAILAVALFVAGPCIAAR